jgi:ABC-2 type transport system permease protein
MVDDFSLAGLVGLAGQALSVAMLLTAGIAASWSFGREFVDEAVPALFALATTRSSVARAKFWVLAGWAVLTVVAAVGLTVLAGVGIGLSVDGPATTMALHAVVTGLLSAALACPFAFVSSWRRGYLAGFVALLAAVVVTQLVTATGGGGWFPYAAPSLWMGMGGAVAADAVTPVQLLLLPLLVAAAAIAVTVGWWRRAEAR